AGAVDAATRERLLAAAQHIDARAFTLCLDQCGYFRQPQIPWLGPSQPPAALAALAEALARLLAGSGVNGGGYRFRPHVSLARRAPAPLRTHKIVPVTWPVRRFCLLHSGSGGAPGAYHCLRSWPLP